MKFPSYKNFYFFVLAMDGVYPEFEVDRNASMQTLKPVYKSEDPKEAFIHVTWVSGGMTGGNCWGGSADCPVTPDPEPEFKEFDTLLETINPAITFRQYKTIYENCVETCEAEGYREYYGNYTNRTMKKVNLKKLYDVLIEKKVIEV